jgi:hypothetical protein
LHESLSEDVRDAAHELRTGDNGKQ